MGRDHRWQPAKLHSVNQLALYLFPCEDISFTVSRAAMEEEDHATLVERVTIGFGALLEQVQELAAKNDALEKRLTQVGAEVHPSFSLPATENTST